MTENQTKQPVSRKITEDFFLQFMTKNAPDCCKALNSKQDLVIKTTKNGLKQGTIKF